MSARSISPVAALEQCATATPDRQRPDALEGSTPLFELVEKRCRLVAAAEREQRLDRVAVEAEQRFANACTPDSLGKRAEKAVSLCRVSQRELEEAADGEQLEVRRHDSDVDRELQGPVRLLANLLDPPEVGVDERIDRQDVRLLGLPDFPARLVGLLGIALGALPVAGQALGARELGQDVRQRVLVALGESSAERLQCHSGLVEVSRPLEQHPVDPARAAEDRAPSGLALEGQSALDRRKREAVAA